MSRNNKNFFKRSPIVIGIISSLIASLILSIAGFFINSAFSIKPELVGLNKRIDSLNYYLSDLKKGTDVVENHIIQRPIEGIPCKVGANFSLKGHTASVYLDNPFGLKQQDCIELTYRKGLTKISVTVIVDVIANTTNNSKADIFLGPECLEIMGISKKEQQNTGIFNMSYKIHVSKVH